MADYLISHRKVKDEFFNQVNILIDWSGISKIIDNNYSKSGTKTGQPAYSGLGCFTKQYILPKEELLAKYDRR